MNTILNIHKKIPTLKLHSEQKYSILSLRVLLLVYLLFCVIAVLFLRTVFDDILLSNSSPSILRVLIFFTIPAILVIFFFMTVFKFIHDAKIQKLQNNFRISLVLYFSLSIILVSIPAILISILSNSELTKFWKSQNAYEAVEAAQDFVIENYNLKLEKFSEIQNKTNFDNIMRYYPDTGDGRKISSDAPSLSAGILAVQDFEYKDENWISAYFAGGDNYRIRNPPAYQNGFIVQELPRDTDLIRYVDNNKNMSIRIVTYSLGVGFDELRKKIDREADFFEAGDSTFSILPGKLFFYYLAFWIPAVLITLLIIILYTRELTSPIYELSKAIMRVSGGDFSTQVQPQIGSNELITLEKSFNVMVKELEKSRNELLQTEKINIWQTMAGQLAHEIKNPLTPIKLTAERLLRRFRSDPAAITEIVDSSMLAIIQEVDSLTNLLNEFRTLSKPIVPNESSTVIANTINETIAPFNSSHPNIIFDTANVAGVIEIKMDTRHLTQILNNLVINAIDAMDGNGRIEMRTELIVKNEAHYCRLSIKDNGKGIKKEEAANIFTPYFTTKESGTGLGLPIVERILNDYGGNILFNSEENVGTTFLIDFLIN